MKELGEALKVLFDSVGYFFGIDFLSFFVSGVTCLGAIVFVWVQLAQQKLPDGATSGLGVVFIVIACYVLGMMCFASGRWVRITFFDSCQNLVRRATGRKETKSRFKRFFLAVINDHALSDKDIFKEYLDKDKSHESSKGSDPTGRLYVRLWAEVRQSKRLSASYALLNRYWFLTATYDGLAMALVIWLLVVVIWSMGLGVNAKLNLGIGVALIAVLVLLAIACWREANRYKQYQVEELVATWSHQIYQRSLEASEEKEPVE